MKICFLSLFLCIPLAWAQTPAKTAEEIKPDTVIAVVNGKPYTAEDVDRLLAPVSPIQRQAYMRDPQSFLEQYGMYELIGQMAEKAKVDEKSPYKEQIAENRRTILVQAYVTEYTNAIPILPADQKKYYDASPDKFRETKVKMIMIPFGVPGAAGKKALTEAEAKAKAENVVRLARSGVNFVKLVKEHSEDPGTVGHDGDLGMGVRATSTNVPDSLRMAILGMKQGEISEPIKQLTSYIIFRAESIGMAPYDSVKDDIFKAMKEEEVRKLVDETKKKVSVKIENGAYFKQPGPAK